LAALDQGALAESLANRFDERFAPVDDEARRKKELHERLAMNHDASRIQGR
jgi:hypothetical protein